MNANGKTIETLARSETFQSYERAYKTVTGMPLALRPTETWQLPFYGKSGQNAFCALIAGNSHTCAACLQLQAKLTQDAANGPATRTCVYGLCETAVPIKLGPQTVGFLQTGQVLRRKPTAASFQRAVDQAAKLGVDIANEEMKLAYFATPVVSQRKIDSVSDLLAIFAEHLAAKSNQLTLQTVNVEPPFITRAKQFICDHYTEELSLRHVSAVVNTSRFYFCKQFHKVTGLSFTEFVTRTRIEKVQNLLLNPNLRVSEIAYAAGFQSLTHFNRTFKRFVKQSPTKYRNNLNSLDRRPVLLPD
jgi:AraC-like DNA-binding protein